MNQSSLMTIARERETDFKRWIEKNKIPGKDSIIYQYLAYDNEEIPNQQGKTEIT